MNRKELQFILQEGEGYKIEFKEKVAGLDKEMCAFANASGGYIYLGISDDGKIKGINLTNKLKSQIVDIAANCDPAIHVILKEFENILIIEVREAVMNAVIHRDYFQKGANVMVEIFADRVEIASPGGLPKGLNPKEFGTRSVLRNPGLANLFQRIHYIEKMGTGIPRIRKIPSRAGLPPASYKWDDFVTATFPLEEVKTSVKTTQETTQEKILALLKSKPEITRAENARRIGLSADGVKYHLDALRKAGRIRHVGPTKKGRWEIIGTENESWI